MKGKIDFNKAIYILIAVLLVVIIGATTGIAYKNNRAVMSGEEVVDDEIEEETEAETEKSKKEAEVSEIEEGALPTDSELAKMELEDVLQTSKINEQFNLYNYELTMDGIKYNYLANAVTSGEKLSVTAKSMSEEEYNEMIPSSKTQKGEIDGVDVVYNDRSLFNTINGAQIPEYIEKAEKADNLVIRYENTTSELVPMQQMMWYIDGIGYTLESIGRDDYTYEDMEKLTQDFFDATK